MLRLAVKGGAHAAVDATFVQFYPTPLGIATRRGTLSPSYQNDEAAAAGPCGFRRCFKALMANSNDVI